MFKKSAVVLAATLALTAYKASADEHTTNSHAALSNGDTCFESGENNRGCATAKFKKRHHFNRIASFPVCSQIDANCNTDIETSAEIVAASSDGNTLIYSDSPQNQIGFTDITDPHNPAPLGTLAMAGEPTSVAVIGDYALVAVNTSVDYVNVSGELAVVDIETQTIVTSHALLGQPDSIAVSPDGMYAAVVIENERDEDLGNGAPPQLPAGALQIITLNGAPSDWSVSNVDLTGIADLYAGDPEPEYVDINSDNIAVVSLQENNHIILVDLSDGHIVNHFSAGTVNLTQIDGTEEDPAIISLSKSKDGVLREPDGVAWIDNNHFATADEGDLDGGSRGFTLFNTDGEVIYNSANQLDHLTVRFGHYPDGRSGNKGNEPENVELGIYGEERYLFVNSERASLVFVYDVADPAHPIFRQALPAGVAPEGALAIPSRNLLVVASEKDDRGDKMRSVLNIYQYNTQPMSYPSIASVNRLDGTPIPWSALSGLAAGKGNPALIYGVDDSFYGKNRIFTFNVATQPATLMAETYITDSNNVLATLNVVDVADDIPANDPSRINTFDDVDLAAMINSDKTVNLDPEGIAKATEGGFWIVSEGSGTVGDNKRPINSHNLLIKTDAEGIISQVITLPAALNDDQLRFGFEGVTEYNSSVYVAFQRVWSGTGDNDVRIGIYDTINHSWSFLYYPLEAANSQNGGWVGLSDIASLGDGQFLVIERDNQGGPDAAIKRLYRFDVTGLVDGDTVTKILVRDLIDDLQASGGLIPEKIEGLAVTTKGDVYIVNDNDGVDDNSGETQLINLGKIL